VLSNADLTEGGIDISARDKMSNFSGIVGYRYNVTEKASRFFGEIEYGALLPVFKLGTTGTSERSSYNRSIGYDAVTDSLYTKFNPRLWTEQDIYAGVKLPFTLNKGSFFTDLQLYADWHWLNVKYTQAEDLVAANEKMQALETGFTFYSIKRKAKRQIYPRLGIGSQYIHRGTVSNTLNEGTQNFFWLYGYLPSPIHGMMKKVAKNHGIYLSFISQVGSSQQSYHFRNYLPTARGYASSFINDKGSRMAVNYAFPLFYPDLAVGPFAFIQRVKANVFYDKAVFKREEIISQQGRWPAHQYVLRSAGAEITFDLRAIRLLDIEMGFRYSYLKDAALLGAKQHNIEFILLSITP
jgi:hypothetical protein